MKRKFLILLCLLSNLAWGQDTLGLKRVNNEETPTVEDSLLKYRPMPSYVIIVGNKQLLFDSDYYNQEYGKEISSFFKPKLIKEMKIVRGADAINKYGEFGKNGVVQIWLKPKAFKDLNPELKERFQPIKD